MRIRHGIPFLVLLSLGVFLPRPGHVAEPPEDLSPPTLQYEFTAGLLRKGLFEDAIAEATRFLEAYPEDRRTREIRFFRAEAHYARGAFHEAGQDYYLVLKQDGDPARSSLARVRYGACLFELNRFEDASRVLAPLIREGEAPPERMQPAMYYYGRSLLETGHAGEGIAILLQLRDPVLQPLALYAAGDAHTAGGEPEAAAGLFRRVASEWPDHPLADQARLREGEALRAAGSLEAAAQAYRRILDASATENATRRHALLGLAWVRLEQNDFAQVLTLSAQLLDAADASLHPVAHHLSGLSHFQQGAHEKALRAFDQVTEGDLVAASRLKSAWAWYLLKDMEKASEALHGFRTLHPEDGTGESAYLTGRIACAREAWDAAVSAFDQARRAPSPFQERAMYEYALALEQAGRIDAAIVAYQEAMERHPGHEQTEAMLVGAGRLLMRQGRYESALGMYLRLGARDGTDDTLRQHALNQQALCYYWLGQFENMRETYERLLKQFPHGDAAPEALYWLGWHHGRTGDHAKAIEAYRRLLLDFSGHPMVSKTRYALASAHFRHAQPEEAVRILLQLAREGDADLIADKELLWLGQRLVADGDWENADQVYARLLGRKPGGMLQAVTLHHQAEVKRKTAAHDEALTLYRQLLGFLQTFRPVDRTEEGFVRSLANEGRHGAAVCLRMRGDHDEARAMLDSIEVRAGDPFVALVHFERGLLEKAAGRPRIAAEHLMRVGLLMDDEALAGEALLRAGEACLEAGDRKKARVCFEELAGIPEDSYGQRYPESPFRRKGIQALAALNTGGQPATSQPTEVSGASNASGSSSTTDSSSASGVSNTPGASGVPGTRDGGEEAP